MREEVPGAFYYNFFLWLENELWYSKEEHFAGSTLYDKILKISFNQDWI